MLIGQLARTVGVTTSRICFYEKQKIIARAARLRTALQRKLLIADQQIAAGKKLRLDIQKMIAVVQAGQTALK